MSRRRAVTLAVVAGTLVGVSLATPSATAVDPRPFGVTLTPIRGGLTRPVAIASAFDNTGRLFVAEQSGRVRVVLSNTALQATPYLDIRDRVRGPEEGGNEQGLLGIAFPASFAQHGYFFVSYTDSQGDLRVSRFRASPPSASTVSRTTEYVYMDIPHRENTNHNGGQLQFGKDGNLYISTGDGGGGGGPNGYAQSVSSHLGKVLRIAALKPAGPGRPYSIPSNNPYATSTTAKREILHYGYRNPWRFSLDAASQTLVVADVGQSSREEINISGPTSRGLNFGWDCREGTLNVVAAYGGAYCTGRTFIAPVFEYLNGGGRCAIVGGNVYRGTAAPSFAGIYVYADYCSGEIWGLGRDANGTWRNTLLRDHTSNITSFGESQSRNIYVVDNTTLYRVVPYRK